MAYTFYKAMGMRLDHLYLKKKIDLAKQMLEKFKTSKAKVLLPKDNVVAAEFKNEAPSAVVDADKFHLTRWD